MGSIATMVVGMGVLAGLMSTPAQAVPDAATPTLLGVTLGAEGGFSGPGVGSHGTPYYVYATGGVARILAVKGELLGGGGRPDMKVVTLQYAILPLPLVSVVAEPGVTIFDNKTGATLGVRATGGVPLVHLRLTGYARAHFVSSRTTTEIGLGVDYPITSLVHASVSGIQFNGGPEPNGTLFLAGLKVRFGL